MTATESAPAAITAGAVPSSIPPMAPRGRPDRLTNAAARATPSNPMIGLAFALVLAKDVDGVVGAAVDELSDGLRGAAFESGEAGNGEIKGVFVVDGGGAEAR